MAELIQPRTLKGFRDYLPELMMPREHLLEQARRVYRSYGFAPIDTPALEYAEILLGKGGDEVQKLIYRFKDHGDRDVALRFDLTVPFARFAAQNVGQLGVPFKRYHMGPVWRGENTAHGRFREFWQCDFDTIGTTSNAADIEVALVIHDLLVALGTTLKITVLAFALAVVLGVAAAFLFVQSRLIEARLFPYAILLQVTPVVAVAPLIIIWVKQPTMALVICATLVTLFPIISNTVLGLRSVNPGLVNLFKLNRASRWQTLVRLRIPSALPFFFGGLRISSGLALIGAVVAEFVAGTGGTGAGLAYEILQAGFQINIPRLFAALALISLTGIALFVSMDWLSKKALGHWHDSAQGA